MNWMSFLYGCLAMLVVCIGGSILFCLYAMHRPQLIARTIMKAQTQTFKKLAARQ